MEVVSSRAEGDILYSGLCPSSENMLATVLLQMHLRTISIPLNILIVTEGCERGATGVIYFPGITSCFCFAIKGPSGAVNCGTTIATESRKGLNQV